MSTRRWAGLVHSFSPKGRRPGSLPRAEGERVAGTCSGRQGVELWALEDSLNCVQLQAPICKRRPTPTSLEVVTKRTCRHPVCVLETHRFHCMQTHGLLSRRQVPVLTRAQTDVQSTRSSQRLLLGTGTVTRGRLESFRSGQSKQPSLAEAPGRGTTAWTTGLASRRLPAGRLPTRAGCAIWHVAPDTAAGTGVCFL